MASSVKVPTASGSAANGGTVNWDGLNSTYADDTSYASAIAPSFASATSYRAYVSGFGFEIPTGATINGITVSFVYYGTTYFDGDGNNYVAWVGAWIRKADGSFSATNKKSSGDWPSSMSTLTIGSSSDLWGEEWTPAQINDADFGLGWQVWMSSGSRTKAYVDCVGITVTYTIPSSIKTLNGLAVASVKTRQGLAIASVKTWNGLA